MKYFIIQNSATGDFIQDENTNDFITTFEISNAKHFGIEYAAIDFIHRNNLDDAWNVVAMTNDEPTYFDLKTVTDKYKWHYISDDDYPSDGQTVYAALENGNAFITVYTKSGYMDDDKFHFYELSCCGSDNLGSTLSPYAWCNLPSIPEIR